MIKGTPKNSKHLTADELLDATNGGYDIYMYYIGQVKKIMDRPWGKRESKPSWGIIPKNGLYVWKDLATEEKGNAITFVMKRDSLSYKDAMNQIQKDLNFDSSYKPDKAKIQWQPPVVFEKEYVPIDIIDQPFTKRHHEFWNAVEVTEDHCRKYNTFAVKKLAIKKQRVHIGKDEIVFAYYAPEEEAYKIYFPERPREKRFRNNVSYKYLWNLSQVTQCDNLIIQKSMKDLLVTTMITPCCIATQAEAIHIFDEEVVSTINSISDSPWVWYGSDWDGVQKCKKITDANKWKYINTPKNLLPEINDTYGYVKEFDLKTLEAFMKRKRII